MPTDCTISYQNSGYFSPLMVDYLDQKSNLKPLYNRFPALENFENQIKEKDINFNKIENQKRATLVAVLQKQYQNIAISEITNKNIQKLKDSKTYTITTGHQLNLFSGPLYFLYKIITTINLTKQLKVKYPEYNFVPIYWMATEDHDFEEINYFNFKGKKIRWNKESFGPVGRLSTEGLSDVFKVFSKELGDGTNAQIIKKLFKDAYLNHNNLADATRFLANSLFGKYGLVIIDADNSELKKQFIPFFKDELLQQTAFKEVSKTIEHLKEYPIQVNPREVNLFYIENDARERIVFENEVFKINNTKISFSPSEIITELENHPEKFSPNVIMRPLYQELLLPNLCYIGGGGEIAYWLELKSYFEKCNVTFPLLLLRNSVVLATEKQAKKAVQLDLNWKDLFLKQTDLLNQTIKKQSEFPIDLSKQKTNLKKQFEDLHAIAKQTDASFLGAVKAQEKKQINGLDNLEKRLLKAQKRKHSEQLNRIATLQNELFPNRSLQERQINFSEFYLENGDFFIEKLFESLIPLDHQFTILTF